MIYDKVDEVITGIFQSLLSKYQIGSEESINMSVILIVSFIFICLEQKPN